MFFKHSNKKKNRTDEELILEYRNSNDNSVLGDLYQRYTHLVFGVCMKYLKNQEDSKDAVMQIFETLIEKLKHHEVQNFKSWLHVLTKNHCLMQLRSSKKMQHQDFQQNNLENHMELSYSLHHNDSVRLEEDIRMLERAINHLPKEQKECVELFYIKQKPYKEIVSITGYEMKKVKSYIQNGKRNLKIYMEKS
ncbi:sigma-70 family RNA polymerase sigma factor [Fulvivirgaceae bacterium BMA10]|uniref:Sigma-70 family RNA polymerase sigma factor n=1 Tax=Splendidivirga corallicola TaxID=3051826 RepID=A0ABT8KTH9_9BACT|nr:sigma-70 family RNA polymerase sigma factor [Fulvivirgaceae bacterium BMA10]